MEPEIAAAYARWHEAAQRALVATAEEVLAAAKRDAPYDPDGHGRHLRDSGHVEPVSYRRGGLMSVDIVFDGPYAARQHERLDYHHPHGGCAKYLERHLTGAQLIDALARAESEAL